MRVPVNLFRFWLVEIIVVALAVLFLALPGYVTHGGIGAGVYVTPERGILTVIMLP